MQKQIVGIGIAIVMLAAGCGASPPPAAKTPSGPPAPPPVAAAPAPTPVTPPAPSPPMLPPELIAKMDELLKIARPPAAGADALDQAVGAIEQQAKVGALAGEIVAMVGKLTSEQQTEFSRRYGEQFAAIQKPALPTTTP